LQNEVIADRKKSTLTNAIGTTLREALGDLDCYDDFTVLPLQKALPYLCRKSEKFRELLSNIARKSGQPTHIDKNAVTTASACTPPHLITRVRAITVAM
jgi:hypothetical protein